MRRSTALRRLAPPQTLACTTPLRLSHSSGPPRSIPTPASAYGLISGRAASSATATAKAAPPEQTADFDPLDSIEAQAIHLLADGEARTFASSRDPSKVYTVERHNGRIWCDCPAWRFQKVPASQKSCKHIREVFGDAWEKERVARELGVDPEEVDLIEREKAGRKRAPKAKAADSQGGEALAKLAAKLRKASATSTSDQADTVASSSRPRRAASEPTIAPTSPLGPISLTAKSRKGKAKAETIDFQPVAALSSAPRLLLAKTYDLASNKPDPNGWWLSEKLDGVRLFWDGRGGLWSRMGKPFYAPAWWKASLPAGVQLDGEAWMGRGHFSRTAGIVKSHSSDEWNKIRFQVFDVPNEADKLFEERIEVLKALFPKAGEKFAVDDGVQRREASEGDVVDLVEQVECRDKEHLVQMLDLVQKLGGEGLMMRKPRSLYEGKRSSTLLKVKTFSDAEALVLAHLPGTGKYKSLIGALKCQTAEGVEFRIGSGMDDEERDPKSGKVPSVGEVVTYRYQEVSKDGVPRFPVYVGIAVDKPFPAPAEHT